MMHLTSTDSAMVAAVSKESKQQMIRMFQLLPLDNYSILPATLLEVKFDVLKSVGALSSW